MEAVDKPSFSFSQATLVKAFLLFSVVITWLWPHLDVIKLGALPLFASFLFFQFSPESWWDTRALPETPLPPITWTNGLIGLILAIPVFLHLGLTWQQEFPFAGDHGYQLYAANCIYELASGMVGLVRNASLKLWGLAILGGALVVSAAVKLPRRLFSLSLIALIGLYAVGFKTSAGEDLIARYPATFYSLTIPLNAVAKWFHWSSPFNANRLTNALSLPVWLWVLRPVFIRRWPDATALLFGALLFWQKDVVYYYTSGFLEPWAIVFLALAAESLVSLPVGKKWISLLWVGLSAVTKEPSIFLLPIFGLALFPSMVWEKTGKDRAVGFLRLVSLGVASAAPFLAYYFLRRKHKVFRGFEALPFQELTEKTKYQEFWARTLEQYGTSGLVALSVIAILAVYLLVRRSSNRKPIAVFLGSTIFMLVFFYVESESAFSGGYPRLMLYCLVPFACTCFSISDEWKMFKGVKAVSLLAVFCLGLNAGPMGRFLALDLNGDPGRNSLEHYGVPVYFPLRTLLKEVDESTLEKLPAKRVTLITFRADLSAMNLAYRDLGTSSLDWERQGFDDENCRCLPNRPALIAFFEPLANLMLTQNPRIRPDMMVVKDHEAVSAARCVAQVKETCEKVVLQKNAQGEPWGILGITPERVSR